jgi:hypothetical protein
MTRPGRIPSLPAPRVMVVAGLLAASLATAGNAAAENSLTDRLVLRQQAHSRPASDDAALAFQVTMGDAVKRSGVASDLTAAEVTEESLSPGAPAGGEISK